MSSSPLRFQASWAVPAWWLSMSSYDTITSTLSHADAGQPLQCQIQLGREDGTNVLLSMTEVAHVHVSHGGHPLEHGGA